MLKPNELVAASRFADELRNPGEGERAMSEPRICDGCKVRGVWEHRCHGADACDCPDCRQVDKDLRQAMHESWHLQGAVPRIKEEDPKP